METQLNIEIVDDNPIFLRDLSIFVTRKLKHRVVRKCVSGEEALSTIDSLPIPDIILMDINLPGMDGIETAKRMFFQNSSIKFIAITQNPSQMYLRYLIEAGFKGFVNKQNLYRQLSEAIKVVLSGALYFPEEMKVDERYNNK